MFQTRVRILGLCCFSALLVIWARVAHLQLALGPWHRANRAESELRTRLIPARRGAIRAGDGTILARDRCDADLEVHYRHLERPLDEAWLTRQARERLTRRERRDPVRLAAAKNETRHEIEAMWQRLAALTGIDSNELDRRATTVQARVERVVHSVNRRRREEWERTATQGGADAQADPGNPDATAPTPRTLRQWLDWLGDAPAPKPDQPVPVTVVEQDRYYTIAENISSDVVLQFTAHPEDYPGVRLTQRVRREYPERELAASVIGYVDSTDDEQAGGSLGRTGIEGFYHAQLQGVPGHVREQISPSGSIRALGGQPPRSGVDITITLDIELQRFAERLIGDAVKRVIEQDGQQVRPTSGALVVLDVRTGAVVVAAGQPAFDLNAASRPESDAARALAERSDSPLFNRIVQMSLPPGSTFKPVTAVAATKSGVDPAAPYFCRGYLHTPDQFRCLIFRHFGVGHDSVTMTEAIARSCNVYFFHLAERLTAADLMTWGQSFGFGERTGIDLAGEERGTFGWREGGQRSGRAALTDGDLKAIAIGQGRFAATPIQVAVMMAAIANGGWRVVPHLRRDAFQPPRSIAGLEGDTDRALALVRRGLEQVVADARGTGHEHVYLSEIDIAGKTGTAQSGSPRGDHAWFAGYVPAGRPEYAIVAVLEHAGSGGHAAAPLVKQLVRHMLENGRLSRSELADRPSHGRQ